MRKFFTSFVSLCFALLFLFTANGQSNPSVTIDKALGQADPTSGSPIHFTVTFSEAVTGFTGSDISFIGSTGFILIFPVVNVAGGPIIFDVAVSGMTSSGTVVATVPAGVVLNAAFQSNFSSTSIDNSVVYNIPPCTITCPSNITVAATSLSGAVVNYSVTSEGDCQNIVRVPVSGTTFPVGISTVNAYNNVSTGAVYGLTSSNQLVTFNVNTAGPTFISSTIPVTGLQAAIPGVQQAEKLAAIDFRPSNGQLYGIGIIPLGDLFNSNEIKLYAINKTTGAATAVGAGSFQLIGLEFSMDFNPVSGELRVLSSSGFNLRVDADLGTVIAADPRVNYPSSGLLDPNNYGFVGIAHSNNLAAANFTTLYIIHEKSSKLYIQGGINGLPSPNTGSATLVGSLGVNISSGIDFTTSSIAGFDISLSAGALASFNVAGANQLYSINLSTGAASLIGTFSGVDIIDIAIAPITFPTPSCSFTVTVNPLLSPAPTVTINQAAGQSDPAVGSPINFTVIFDQAVTGFTSSDVSLSGTAGATTVVVTEIAPNNGTTFNVAVSGMTASGTVIASISANVALNSNNVGNTVSSSTDNTVTFVNQSPDLTISKAPNTSEVSAGEEVGFTITVTNAGTGDALNVTITDALPTGLDWTLTSSPPGFSIVANVLGGNIGTLAAGENIVVTINALSNAGSIGPITNTATVSCTNEPQDATSNNSSTATVTVLGPDIMVVKTANSSIVNGGGTVGFTITITNIGSGTAFGANVNDALPAGLNWTLTSPPAGFSIAANTLSGYISTLAPGASVAVTFTAVTAIGYSGLITNTATVSCTNESVSAVNNNSSTATITVVGNTEPPTISCPGDITLYTNPGFCHATISSTGENAVIIAGGPATMISYSALDAFGFGSSGSGNSLPTIYLSPGIIFVTISATNSAGTASCSFTVTVIDNQPPIIVCPDNKVVNAEPGKCTSASVPITIIVTEGCRVNVFASHGTNGVGWGINGGTDMPLNGGLGFPVGINTVSVTATDASGNTSTCSFTVTVLDNEKPVITAKPSDVTVECESQIPAANISSVSATDNCGTPTITHVGDVITDQTCANKYTVTRTYKATDGSGNTATCSQLITVDDNTPPRITGLTSSKQVLWPANHKMVDVMLNYTVNDNCVSTPNVNISITSNEPENGTGDGDTDTDWEIIDDHHIRIRAERAANGTGRNYTITVRVSDGCNASVSATTQVMVVHNITAPHSGNSFKVGSTVVFSGEFWDKPGNKHTAKWQIDGSTTSGAVTEPSGNKNGKVTGSYKFNTPGVYKLQMNVTDQTGVTSYANTNGDLEAIIVIYDPNGGHTYGGGYYDSRAGALVSNPSSTGKASYGFAMNYFKNSTNPKGETQFEFKVGEFEFNALNFEYLVISNSMAQFKGTGKIIGGQSGVAFTMTVTDGQLDGSGIDKIRMKIYNKNNGKIIYDNQPGASDAALPTQAVGANSIVVISGINSSLTSPNTSQKTGMEATESKTVNGLDVVVYPNPSINNFSITVRSGAKEKITMQVVDMYGRIIETRNVNANSPIRFGDRYNPGTYFVRIIQGKQHKEIKLVKLSD